MYNLVVHITEEKMFNVMESERENKRKRGSGRFRNENKTKKDLGKSCVTYKGLQNPANVPLTLNEVTCKCYFDCKTLNPKRMRLLHEEFYKQNTIVQGTYLMTLIHLAPLSRRRNGLYKDSSDSRRQHTVCYTVSNEKGKMIRILKAAIISSDNAKVKLQLHHRKAEAASQKMREDIANSQLPGSSVTCLAMDLEQVSHVLF
ncbi:membrane-associated guanylate kinase maguk [Holotrichia oblita]|uniref:Membrane-associated guanylate kinase maguk n=1 Tax=Holotrichia oblita TaxID=644536 RepID=A0ACB9SY84_HOLOL|nr:membrane-associated guanylate kinase maguk [Holotrichia oblita]